MPMIHSDSHERFTQVPTTIHSDSHERFTAIHSFPQAIHTGARNSLWLPQAIHTSAQVPQAYCECLCESQAPVWIGSVRVSWEEKDVGFPSFLFLLFLLINTLFQSSWSFIFVILQNLIFQIWFSKIWFSKTWFSKMQFSKMQFSKIQFSKMRFSNSPKFNSLKFNSPKCDSPKCDSPKCDFPKFNSPKFNFLKFNSLKFNSPTSVAMILHGGSSIPQFSNFGTNDSCKDWAGSTIYRVPGSLWIIGRVRLPIEVHGSFLAPKHYPSPISSFSNIFCWWGRGVVCTKWVSVLSRLICWRRSCSKQSLLLSLCLTIDSIWSTCLILPFL